MRSTLLLVSAVFLAPFATADRAPAQAAEAPAIIKAAASAPQVRQYEKIELGIELRAVFDNPFDPDQVRLDAVFRSPSGKELSVPGFFMIPERRNIEGDGESFAPTGPGVWRVRFAPSELGRYTWRLTLQDRGGKTAGGEGTFESVAGPKPGFLRISKADPHYLAFDRGDGFFAIGHNVPIYHTKGQLGDQAMRKLAAAGENFNRWWMCSYGLGLEWEKQLGRYRQDAAARLDLILDFAGELGQYYMMCMDTHQDFRERGWQGNPFNAANGGPCKTPADWFTSPVARELYKKRLRYTVARWGYSPHVLCWEFGNEFEGWADTPQETMLPWHREMSDYLRSLDPFGHLITTSFWSQTGPEAFWELPNIDIVQTHCYTNDDGNVALPVRRYCLHQWKRFAKPHIFGEFGIRSHSTTAEKDPKGWAIHNSLWAGLMHFAAGGPMPWWHENYIDPLNLYFHFTALGNFTKDLPLGTARWEPVDTLPPEFVDKSRKPETRDAVVIPTSRWGKPEQSEFVLQSDGTIQDDRLPQQLLHGDGHSDLQAPITFAVRFPRPGQFIVRVATVSNSGLLRVWLDDKLALERSLPCGEKLGKKSTYQSQWKLWETVYDEDVRVDVPAGAHRIRIQNFGRDWVSITKYTFTGARVLDRPNVLVCGMRSPQVAILWLQNLESDWFNHGQGQVAQVEPFTVAVRGLRDGRYQVQWWDTWNGKVERSEAVEVRNGLVRLTVGPLKTDVAAKLRPEN